MGFDGLGVEVAGAGAVRGVGVRLVQPGGARSERAVDEQVTGQPAGPGLVHQRARLCGRGYRLTPVADHLDAVVEGAQLQPVVQPADLGAGAFVHRDDPGRGGGVQRRCPGFGQLFGGQQVAGDGPDQVMRVAGQRPLQGANPAADGNSATSRRSPVEASAEWTSMRAR